MRRRKIDQPGDEGDPDYNWMEDFFEAIGEHHTINPRFIISSEIMDLVECWEKGLDT